MAAEHGSANLKRVSVATGKVDPLTDAAHDVVAYSATADASRIAATVSTQTNIGDIAIVDVARGFRPDAARGSQSEVARSSQSDVARGSRSDVARGFQPSVITHVNDELFKDIQQSEPEEIWYKSFDGKNVQGWILKPPDFDASKKYPLILEIHGGPHGAYGNTYTHEFMWMAAKGYVV